MHILPQLNRNGDRADETAQNRISNGVRVVILIPGKIVGVITLGLIVTTFNQQFEFPIVFVGKPFFHVGANPANLTFRGISPNYIN